MGALGAALGTMVANLSSHKRGWDDRWKEFSDWAEQGKKYQEEFLSLIDKDTAAFNAVMDAYSMPGSTDAERTKRNESIETATKNAMMVPLRIMEVASEAMVLVRAMAETGNPGSVSDAGVGALALRACVYGAFLNVRINASGLKDRELTDSMVSKGKILLERAEQSGQEILALVEEKL